MVSKDVITIGPMGELLNMLSSCQHGLTSFTIRNSAVDNQSNITHHKQAFRNIS